MNNNKVLGRMGRLVGKGKVWLGKARPTLSGKNNNNAVTLPVAWQVGAVPCPFPSLSPVLILSLSQSPELDVATSCRPVLSQLSPEGNGGSEWVVGGVGKGRYGGRNKGGDQMVGGVVGGNGIGRWWGWQAGIAWAWEQVGNPMGSWGRTQKNCRWWVGVVVGNTGELPRM